MEAFVNIQQYQDELVKGESTCVSAVNYYLQCIDASASLNAFVEVFREESLATATMLDQKRQSGLPMGRLHGVVIAIKDVLCYKDHVVTAASRSLQNFKSLFTATAIQHLIDEEAIIIGNCNCDEFAMGSTNENSIYGPVLNALDQTKVSGGSSGGSAVAVQAGLCMLSLGTDTGGSVRQPAGFCGIIGMKPGYGSISRYGLIAYASSFDQVGVFGNTVSDVALAIELMNRPDKLDSTMSQTIAGLSLQENNSSKKLRIAVFPEMLNHPSLDNEISAAIQTTLESMRAEGHVVEDVNFPLTDYIVPAYYVLTTAEASSNLSRYDGIRYGHQTEKSVSGLNDFYMQNRTEGFGKEVKRRILLGTFVLSTGYHDAFFTKAQQVRQMLMDELNEIFKTYDAIILPTTTSTAYSLGDNAKDPIATYLADIFTVFANLTGTPAISLPLYKHSNGLPFGLQIICARGNEQGLFQLSELLYNKTEMNI